MHLTSQYGSSPSQYPIRDSWRPRQLQRLLASQKPSFTSTLSHGPGGCSPGSVHPDNVQVAEVHAFLVKPGIAGASTKTQVGASALGCRGWRFHGGSCLALPCTQEEERGGEEVRTPGLPGLGDPRGSSSCTIRKLAPLVLRNHWLARGSPSYQRCACTLQW